MGAWVARFGKHIGLVMADSRDDALERAKNSWGSYQGPYIVREATLEDLLWIKDMGGWIP